MRTTATRTYGIDSEGRIGLYCDEKNRPWTSSSPANDHQAITIEVANDGGAPDWHVSDKALTALVDLCVDICKRDGIPRLNFTGDATGNLTQHNYFAATGCPGPYLKSKFPYIASEVNKRLGTSGGSQGGSESTEGESDPTTPSDTLYRVQVGAFSQKENADAMLSKVKAAGFDAFVTTKSGSPVSSESIPTKTIDELAKEVINGKWGSGSERKSNLTQAGYDYDKVQARVNELV